MRTLVLLLATAAIGLASGNAFALVEWLQLGNLRPDFDHLGALGRQLDTASKIQSTLLFASGLGVDGYSGLPTKTAFDARKAEERTYAADAHKKGIKLALGYLCATSMVQLADFNRNWKEYPELAKLGDPAAWRQQDIAGNPLPSWYGGSYTPACMNNPEWRAYEGFTLGQTLGAGYDGVFFDNPTVHTQGCYCPFCMKGFAHFIGSSETDVTRLRSLTLEKPQDLARYRTRIAPDFLREMRSFASRKHGGAILTCNNSLNSPARLFADPKDYGYSIPQLAEAEDLIVIEDMETTPRMENGNLIAYAPTIRMVEGLGSGKPLGVITICPGEYITSPNLMKLAIAECTANGAAYVTWGAWDPAYRQRFVDAIAPYNRFLKDQKELMSARSMSEVRLFVPYERWAEGKACKAPDLAARMAAENIQFDVSLACPGALKNGETYSANLLEDAEAAGILKASEADMEKHKIVTPDAGPDPLATLKSRLGPPLVSISGTPTVRTTLRSAKGNLVLHLINYDVRRISKTEDSVTPAGEVHVTLALPKNINVRKARLISPDFKEKMAIALAITEEGDKRIVKLTVPRVDIWSVVVIGQ